MFVRNIGIVVVSATLAACTAQPKTQSEQQMLARQTLLPMFEILDCTDEGHLEAGEIAEHISQIFLPFDRDRSRSLSPTEFSRASRFSDAALAKAGFSMSDANADGAVSSQEFSGYLERLIDVLDADSNGELTLAELQAN